MKKIHIEFDCVVTDQNAKEIINAVNLEGAFECALEIFGKEEYVCNIKSRTYETIS